MRATLATAGAAFLLASTAYVLPVQSQPASPSAQTQPYSATTPTQPNTGISQTQTQPNQATYGATNQVQAQPYTGTGQTQTQPSRMTTQTQASGMANQPRSYSASTQTQGQLPRGSYASSCKDARMDGQTPIALCKKPDGTWQTAALGTSQCTGDIQDVNGILTCGMENRNSSSTQLASPTTQRRY
jgi:hypothetical protein